MVRADKAAAFEGLIPRIRHSQTGEHLDLDGWELDAVDAKRVGAALRTNTSIRSLNLSGNRLGDEGVRLLAIAALPYNTTLAELDLGKNGVTAVGAAHLAAVLPQNKGLKELWLLSNAVGEAGAQHLIAALQRNTTLTDLGFSDEPGMPVPIELYEVLHACLMRNLNLAPTPPPPTLPKAAWRRVRRAARALRELPGQIRDAPAPIRVGLAALGALVLALVAQARLVGGSGDEEEDDGGGGRPFEPLPPLPAEPPAARAAAPPPRAAAAAAVARPAAEEEAEEEEEPQSAQYVPNSRRTVASKGQAGAASGAGAGGAALEDGEGEGTMKAWPRRQRWRW